MNEHIIAFAVHRSKGPCVCQYNFGSCSTGGYDLTTGERIPAKFDRGPCTQRCERCIAREALDADGIEYVKDDRQQWAPWMMGMKIDCAAAPMTLGTVVTGTVSLAFNPYAPDGVGVK